MLIRKCHVAHDSVRGIDSLVQLQRPATPQDAHSTDLSRADEGGERVKTAGEGLQVCWRMFNRVCGSMASI